MLCPCARNVQSVLCHFLDTCCSPSCKGLGAVQLCRLHGHACRMPPAHFDPWLPCFHHSCGVFFIKLQGSVTPVGRGCPPAHEQVEEYMGPKRGVWHGLTSPRLQHRRVEP